MGSGLTRENWSEEQNSSQGNCRQVVGLVLELHLGCTLVCTSGGWRRLSWALTIRAKHHPSSSQRDSRRNHFVIETMQSVEWIYLWNQIVKKTKQWSHTCTVWCCVSWAGKSVYEVNQRSSSPSFIGTGTSPGSSRVSVLSSHPLHTLHCHCVWHLGTFKLS